MDEQQIDIIDNLITQDTTSALSARQGYVLKGYIDKINETIETLKSPDTATDTDIDTIFIDAIFA